jgi:hypothetical protein
MRDKKTYDHIIAEKLKHLPGPDPEETWPAMKALLDSNQKPKGFYFRRWMGGLSLLLLLICVSIFYFESPLTESSRSQATKLNPPPEQVTGSQTSEPTQTEANNTTENPTDQYRENSTQTTKENKDTKNTTAIPDNTATDAGTQLREESALQTPGGPAGNKSKTNIGATDDVPNDAATLRSSKPISDENREAPQKANTVNRKRTTEDADESGLSGDAVNLPRVRPETTTNRRPVAGKSDRNNNPITDVSERPSGITEDDDLNPVIAASKDAAALNFNRPSATIRTSPRSPLNRIIAVSSTPAKAKKSRFAPAKRTFAAGFSFPLGFPLGDQRALGYNFNAGSNTVSDYIPAPHLQYHIHSKLYLQTELQFISPQYIQPVLLSQYNQRYSPNMLIRHSVYAEKLYYFNIPVGIHYSPFEHFYLGTGLQFSSLISGVALFEDKKVYSSGSEELVRGEYQKFRNDTLSQKFDNSELRLALDANYYWNKFTVGLRYNQALSNYASLRANAGLPLFQDKNKSLQFYLRYNLWERK